MGSEMCIRDRSSSNWSTTKTPVISNHIRAISHRNAFICMYSNFSLKIGCHGNAPLSLVFGSVTGEFPMAHTLSQTKLCMDVSLTTEVMTIFVIFWPILAKIWLPWQRPLDPCNQKCLLWIGQPRKSPVISNGILGISRRNAFMCIYSNFCPKIGRHGNAPLSHVYGSLTYEFVGSANLVTKPNAARICCIQLKLWP